jgi:hypothetical protein
MPNRRRSDGAQTPPSQTQPEVIDWKARYESVLTERHQLAVEAQTLRTDVVVLTKKAHALEADRYRLLENQRRLLRNHLSVSRALSEAHDVLTDLREDILRQTNDELTKMEGHKRASDIMAQPLD